MRGQPGAPRPLVEQLGPRERHHGAPGLAQLAAEVLDQVELARRGPVDVLVDDEHRPLRAEALEHAPQRQEEEALGDDRGVRAEPEEEGEVARRVLRLGGRQERGDARDELLPGDLLGVGVEDAERLPDELGRRVVAGALLVRHAAAAQDEPSRRLDLGPDLADEPRLADPRRADHGDELRPALVDRLAPDRADDVQLARAPDERPEPRRPLRGLDERADGEPGLDRLRLPLRVDRRQRLVLDGVAGRPLRLPAHDEPARRRGRLQPGGGVDDVADRKRLSRLGPTHRDERLARVHGRARGEPRPAPVEPVDGGEQSQPGADGALGVVAVGERRAEDRHHRVADELLEPPAVRLDLVAGSRVEAREGLADVLRVGPLGRRREALQVDEEDGDEPPLLPQGGGERRTAVGAEARVGVGAPAAPLADQLLTGLDPHVPSIVPQAACDKVSQGHRRL